jgi:hypothetical protein
MKLSAVNAALAILVAGASSLWAGDVGPREEGWKAFLERCDRKADERRLERTVKRLSERERLELRERLKRIRLMTEAWVRAERQARCARAAKAVGAVFVPAMRQPMDWRPAMEFIMQMNGFAPRRGGVIGRKGRQLM